MTSNFDAFKQYNEIKEKPKNRKGPDLILKSLFWISVFSWIFFGITFLFFFKAYPQEESFFNKVFEAAPRRGWNMLDLRYSFFSALILMFLSVISFLLRKIRFKRKSDKHNIFTIFTFFFAFGITITYLLML